MKTEGIRKIIKTFVTGLFVLLLCVSCSAGKTEPEEITEPAEEPVEETVQEEETQEIIEEETVPEKEEDPEPEFYQRANIVFLGCTGEDRDLDMILERAVETLHLDTVKNIKKDHIVYGKQGDSDNVYLIIPEKNITLTIASFPDMSKTYFREEKSSPVIFIENSDVMNIGSVFTAVRSGDKSVPEQFYIGFDPSSNVLFVNDALSRGIDDRSDYDIFDESELPDHASMYEYYLYNEAPGTSEDLQDDNYTVGDSGYMVLDDRLYVTYLIKETFNPDKSYQYAMRYDSQNRQMEYLICLDGSGENWIEMGGE